VNPAKTAESIEMLFGCGLEEALLDGAEVHVREGAILKAKRGQPRTCLDMSCGRYNQSDLAEGRTGMVWMLFGVY